jgi:hypothetical protein
MDKLTKGGPGDKFLGGGKVDTSEWFTEDLHLFNAVKNQDIWFCPAPFSLIYTNTDGQLLPCSWAKSAEERSDVPFGPNIEDVTPEDYFVNDEVLNQLRFEMLTRDSDLEMVDKVCASCRHQEKHYGRSRRQASLKIISNNNDLWPRIDMIVQRFQLAGSRLDKRKDALFSERVLEVQVKAFGNKCNLDCYMCLPFDSSVRTETMHGEHMEDQNVFQGGQLMKIGTVSSDKVDKFIEQIVALGPYIYNLKLIGGEPLVMKPFYKLLEKMVETGESQKMCCKYQTNMSVIEFDRVKISKFIPDFERFEFTVSLDAYGEANNYIRRRSNWEEIVRNIKHVRQYPNVYVNINGAISFLSVLRFHELIDWFNDNKDLFDQINWSNIRGPEKLCANMLPAPIKEKLIPKYEGFPDIQQLLKEEPFRRHGKELNINDTFEYCLMMDKRYKGTKWEMNLFDVFPELQKYYKPDMSHIRFMHKSNIQEIEL